MANKRKRSSQAERWMALDRLLKDELPHFWSWYNDIESFGELRIKARDDGTTLAVCKGYDAAGGPVVCFASGYGLSACLMAVDAVLNGGRWKVDKPWPKQ